MLRAVIFDFDGVIVDTEALHHQAFEAVLAEDGISYTWEEYQEHFIGFDDRDGFRAMYHKAKKELDESYLPAMVDNKAGTFANMVQSRDVEPYPGVVELIRSLCGSIPLALCSGALRSDVDPILSRLDLESVFDAVVTAEDVSKSKPDPESYSLAVMLLRESHPAAGISPELCVAVEDTPTGLEAAQSAGLAVLAVSNTHQAHHLERATLIVESLVGVDLDRLSRLVEQ